MEESPKSESRTARIGKLLLKLAVTAVCLWYVSGKIDFPKAGTALRQANWLLLLPALLAFILSKLIAAFRLHIYFRNIGLPLSGSQNLRLYWLGMFYNLFLPGAVSGDAYKVILLKKKCGAPYKDTTAAVLLDRFSGLLGLGLILSAYAIFVLDDTNYVLLLAAGSLAAVVLTYLLISRYWKLFRESFYSTLLLGILVQAVQVACVYAILAALGITGQQPAYIFIFLLSSLASVLPVTIGGLGIREMVFLEGSRWLGLSSEQAVVISLIFYILTLITSLAGLGYVFRDPLKKTRP